MTEWGLEPRIVILVLDGHEWIASYSGCFTLEERVFECPHTVAEWVPAPIWTRSQSKKSLSSHRIENQSFDVWSRHYTDQANPWHEDNSNGNTMPTSNRFSYEVKSTFSNPHAPCHCAPFVMNRQKYVQINSWLINTLMQK